jgi:hypothetical protein
MCRIDPAAAQAVLRDNWGSDWLTFVNTQRFKTQDRETRTSHDLHCCELFVWAVVILLLNQLSFQIKEEWSASLERLLYNLEAIGAFQFMAWYVVFGLLRDSDPVRVARWRDLVVTAALFVRASAPAR